MSKKIDESVFRNTLLGNAQLGTAAAIELMLEAKMCKVDGCKSDCVHTIQKRFWLGIAFGFAIFAGVILA